jgi:hypothetical protein
MNAREYLQSCRAEDVLSEEAFPTYDEMMRGIWPHIIALNTNLYLLSKIIAFPFAFLGIDPQPYWTATQRALFDGCILVLWRVVLDTNPAGRTLIHVKNQLFASLQDGRALKALAEVMEEDFPSGWQTAWGAKVEEIRHNYVAHFDFHKHVRPTEEDVKQRALSLSDLKEVQEQVMDLFDVLALGVGFMAIPLEYDPGVRKGAHEDQRSDIERLLDSLARESHLVNLPESNPLLWPWELKRMSAEDRDRLNAFRRRFGLSEV